mmetsp:Transcript_14627/g.23178  ORF Transcript_14627/g.23178 Transcript_14627/m.23178 type:complete len:432 (-) Transcript_14627:123-1418(-)
MAYRLPSTSPPARSPCLPLALAALFATTIAVSTCSVPIGSGILPSNSPQGAGGAKACARREVMGAGLAGAAVGLAGVRGIAKAESLIEAGKLGIPLLEERVLGEGKDALKIRSVVNGLWQVSGAHGRIDGPKAVEEMFKYVDAGLTTWDAADIYGPAEVITREFRKAYRTRYGEDPPIQVLTKYVPRPGDMPFELIEAAIDQRLARLGVNQIDLLQFHWWDYSNKNYINAMKHMKTLKDQGKIRNLALTNFDTKHMRELVEEYDIPIVSNQVQFSMLDRRPLNKMVSFAKEHDIKLLAYGVLCGGLLTDKYLGVKDPTETLDTASKQKYWYGTVNEWGDWQLFQKLLKTLKTVGDRHGVSIANVAERYILDQDQVGGVIIGARLSRAQHISENLNALNLSLSEEDYKEINSVLNQGKMLPGDCGDEYRRYY